MLASKITPNTTASPKTIYGKRNSDEIRRYSATTPENLNEHLNLEIQKKGKLKGEKFRGIFRSEDFKDDRIDVLFEEIPANDEVVKRGVLHRLRIGRDELHLQPVHHVGVVKKRGQVNKAYKERVFTLDKDSLEYYAWSPADDSSTSADNHAYFNRMHDISSMKGCLSTRDLKVTPATTDGVESSSDGYHFSIEVISSGKIIECACENAIFRDTWVSQIQEAHRRAVQDVLHVRDWIKCEMVLGVDKIFIVLNRVTVTLPLLDVERISRTSDTERKINLIPKSSFVRLSNSSRRFLGQSDLGHPDVEATVHEILEGANIFEVHMKQDRIGGGPSYFFYAANEQDCVEWVGALENAYEDAIEASRPTKLTWKQIFVFTIKKIYEGDFVQYAVVCIILANFLANVVEFEIMSNDKWVAAQFDVVDYVFTSLFTLELLCNLVANSDIVPFPFLRSGWNLLDVVVVIVSIISILTQSEDNGVKAIRILRAFRVIRLFKRLPQLRMIVTALFASMIPVANVFMVVIVATAVFAVLGVGLFSDRPDTEGTFGHFSAAFFTMFQCISGDGWASNIARPMFGSAESTCTYRDDEGKCVFDMVVAVFFLSYILIVVLVIVNVVLAVLIDEFLKAAANERKTLIRENETILNVNTEYHCPLDPFLKYLSTFHNSAELTARIDEGFLLMDTDCDGIVCYEDMSDILQCLNVEPKATITVQDWYAMIDSYSEDDYVNAKQFYEVLRNQVTLYIQRKLSLALALIDSGMRSEESRSTTVCLKYLITAVDDLMTKPNDEDHRVTSPLVWGVPDGRLGGRVNWKQVGRNPYRSPKDNTPAGNDIRGSCVDGDRDGEGGERYFMESSRSPRETGKALELLQRLADSNLLQNLETLTRILPDFKKELGRDASEMTGISDMMPVNSLSQRTFMPSKNSEYAPNSSSRIPLNLPRGSGGGGKDSLRKSESAQSPTPRHYTPPLSTPLPSEPDSEIFLSLPSLTPRGLHKDTFLSEKRDLKGKNGETQAGSLSDVTHLPTLGLDRSREKAAKSRHQNLQGHSPKINSGRKLLAKELMKELENESLFARDVPLASDRSSGKSNVVEPMSTRERDGKAEQGNVANGIVGGCLFDPSRDLDSLLDKTSRSSIPLSPPVGREPVPSDGHMSMSNALKSVFSSRLNHAAYTPVKGSVPPNGQTIGSQSKFPENDLEFSSPNAEISMMKETSKEGLPHRADWLLHLSESDDATLHL